MLNNKFNLTFYTFSRASYSIKVSKIQKQLQDKESDNRSLEVVRPTESSIKVLSAPSNIETSSPYFKVPAVPSIAVTKAPENSTVSYNSPVFDFGS